MSSRMVRTCTLGIGRPTSYEDDDGARGLLVLLGVSLALVNAVTLYLGASAAFGSADAASGLVASFGPGLAGRVVALLLACLGVLGLAAGSAAALTERLDCEQLSTCDHAATLGYLALGLLGGSTSLLVIGCLNGLLGLGARTVGQGLRRRAA